MATIAELDQTVGLLLFGIPFALGLVVGAIGARNSLKAYTLAGVAPLIGAEILTYVLFRSAVDLSHPENSESGDSWLGLGPPLLIAIAFLVLGIVLMLLWAASQREFFRSKRETFSAGTSVAGSS